MNCGIWNDIYLFTVIRISVGQNDLKTTITYYGLKDMSID